jgi:uncharacterized cupredoxin-like copper-binding protein
MRTRLALLVVAALAAASVAAAASTPTATQISAGKKVFASAGCGKCHTLTAAGSHGTVGPNLNTVKPALGAIQTQVSDGGRFMPPFGASSGGSLSAAQVADVSAFVYASEHHLSGGAAASTSSGGAKTVKVTAGKPSEFRFTLSSKTVKVGKVVFTITNRGKLVHDFKVCTVPSGSAKTSCNGKGSKKLSPGKSVKLTVTFAKKGSYAYLCTVPGHAAAGMKGLLKAA